MATFTWTGRNKQGSLQKGQMVAKTREEVISLLRKQNILVTSIQQQKAGLLAMEIPGLGGGVGDKDIVVFTRQFATMIDAGLPLVQCLEILGAQTENKLLAKAIQDVREDVESGSTYADALKKHSKIFDDLYVSMVSAGEAGGILDTILNRLAKHIEKVMKLKSQIKAAMFYPATIVGVAVVVISVLMVWVIPTFAKMFVDFGGVLPTPTRIVMFTSEFMQSNFLLIIGGVIASVFGLKFFYGNKKGRRFCDKIILASPVFGPIVRKAAVAKFTRTLGTLISSGVPILDGLGIVAKTSGNKVIEEALLVARQSISEGKTVSEPLEKTKVFPPMVVQMISVGEATGALDAMLGKIADFYDDEVDTAVAGLTSLLEPMLMVFLGVVIGFIVISMYLPIFKMASIVG
ncbi:MAG TPA: type II secretion system F family protein [Nitrospiria bacterium]|jgi:type IV pilus assembly protein PilC